MKSLRKVWAWVVGALAAIGAVVGIAWLRGKGSKSASVDMAKDRANRAREKAQAELDEAVRRGVESVNAADESAAMEVENAGDSLSGYLLECDPGPENDE